MSSFTSKKVDQIVSNLGINIPIDQFYKEYLYQLLEPLFSQLKTTHSIDRLKQIITGWFIDKQSTLLLELLENGDAAITGISGDKEIKREFFINEIETKLIEQIIMSSIASVVPLDNFYDRKYRAIRGDRALNPDDFFYGILLSHNLRSLIFKIMPSDIKIEIINPHVNPNSSINTVVSLLKLI